MSWKKLFTHISSACDVVYTLEFELISSDGFSKVDNLSVGRKMKKLLSVLLDCSLEHTEQIPYFRDFVLFVYL